jgi:hypothetical protein
MPKSLYVFIPRSNFHLNCFPFFCAAIDSSAGSTPTSKKGYPVFLAWLHLCFFLPVSQLYFSDDAFIVRRKKIEIRAVSVRFKRCLHDPLV